MLRNLICFSVCLALVVCGCGKRQATEAEIAAAKDTSPLTLETWKAMGEEKFDLTNLERLRAGDKELEEDSAWDEFMATVVAPELKKSGLDLGNSKPTKNDVPEFFSED